MRVPRQSAAAAALLLAAAIFSQSTAAAEDAAPGDFDFYVLSLSWSPSYCASESAEEGQQCAGRRPYGFIVHGLWPQYEEGYPEYCSSNEPQYVPDVVVENYLDIMPSAGLIGHQWRKHGTCTGLSQASYFELTRKAFQKIAIPADYLRPDAPQMISPEEIEQDFAAANSGVSEAGMAVTCGEELVREIRICLTRKLEFRPCAEVDARSCPLPETLMLPAKTENLP